MVFSKMYDICYIYHKQPTIYAYMCMTTYVLVGELDDLRKKIQDAEEER
jgi:hypothetical protein